MKKKTEKPYWEMSAAELAEATKEYDRPLPRSKMRPPTREERQAFERSRKSPVRSIFISRDPDGMVVRIEPALLKRSMRYATRHKMTLSDVINRSLRGMLAMVE